MSQEIFSELAKTERSLINLILSYSQAQPITDMFPKVSE